MRRTSGSACRRRSGSTRARPHAPPSRGRAPRESPYAAPRPPAAVSGPGRVGGDELQEHRRRRWRRFAETLRVKHRRNPVAVPRIREKQVHEAGTGDLQPVEARTEPRLEIAGEALGDVPWLLPQPGREEHRGVRRVVALLGPFRPLDRRLPGWFRLRSRQRPHPTAARKSESGSTAMGHSSLRGQIGCQACDPWSPAEPDSSAPTSSMRSSSAATTCSSFDNLSSGKRSNLDGALERSTPRRGGHLRRGGGRGRVRVAPA